MTRVVVLGEGGAEVLGRLEAADLDVRGVDTVEAVPDAADCVVCPAGDGWQDAVRRLRERGLPVVVTGVADHAVAATASRLGAEYAPVAALADRDETLVDRVRAHAAGGTTAGVADGGVDATTGPAPDVSRSAWFEAVLDHPTSFVGLLDTDGRVLRVNRTALDTVAADHGALEGAPFWEVPWWTPDDDLRERVRDRVERAAAGETVEFTDDYYARGERRVAHASFAPVRSGGEVVGVVAGGHDVTDLKRNERALQSLNEVATDDAAFEEKVRRLLALGAEFLGVEVGFLTYLERGDDGDYLRMVEVAGDADFGAGDRVPLEEAYCKETVVTEGTLAVHDARESWADDPAFESGLSCYLGGKVEVDDELFGTACFADSRPRERAFSAGERAFVEGLVAWISQELARREDHREITAARDRTQRILERIGDAFFAVDADWAFTYVNERAAAVLDRDPDELVGENVWEAFPDAMADAYYEQYHRAMDEQVAVEFEAYLEPLDRWTEVRAYPDEEGLSVFFSDITRRKRDRQALEDLYTATTGDGDAESTVRELLELGCEYLGLDVGFFSTVDDDDFEVLFARGDHDLIRDGATSPLSETYCRHAVEGGETFVVDDASEELAGDPAYEKFDLGCYLGGNVYVDDDLYGTLCFADDAPRERSFSERERTFVELLVKLASYEWERHEREGALEDLLATTRSLLEADDHTATADVVRHAVEDVIGYDHCVLRRYDRRNDRLEPVLVSGREGERVPDRPAYAADEGRVGRAFTEGETVYEPELGDDAVELETDAVRSAIYLPLGDAGVLTVASTERDGFDEVSRRLLELLAVNVSAALQRADRERALRGYRAVLENVSEMAFALDGDGRITLVTDALADQWGVTPEDAFGKPIGTFVDGEVVAEATDRLAAAAGSVTLETELESATGSRFPAEIHLSPVDADASRGTVGIVHDISELAETRTELSSERERFQYLFDELPDPVVEVGYGDGEAVVRAVNAAFEETFGVDEADAVGRPGSDVVHPPEGTDRGLEDGTGIGGAYETEVERQTPDGARTFIFRAVPYHGAGETRMFAIYTDVTDRKERTRRLELLHRVLRHNLRNDMTVVLGHGELLRDAVDGAAERRAAETILETAERVTDLSQAASQIQRTMSLKPDDAPTEPVADVVTEVVEDRREAHPDVEFTLDAAVSAPTAGGRDSRRAVDEVVENAALYGDGEVSVTTGLEGQEVVIRVADDGPGIPARERRVIAGDGEITQMEHSRGLGLWLTRSIVRACGGSLTFEDAESGTVAVIRLPRR